MERTPRETKGNSSAPRLLSLLLVGILVSIIFQGALRDGVTTWMPSYISETFSLNNEISILSGVILPIFSIISFQATSWLYRKKLKNELVCAGVIFATGFTAALLLSLCSQKSVVFSVALFAVLTGCMHGVNFILVSIVPRHFQKYGNVSFVSGLLNSCTYIGSAVSTYGIALYSESFGWTGTIVLWAATALAGTILCLAFSSKWRKFTE